MKKIILHKYFITVFITLVLISCSTEKNTFVTRNFHNVTAHYNVYFNGNEAMKMGLLKIEEDLEEDFTKILPIFKESLPGAESMVNSNMNTAVEKGMKLIKLHSMTKPPESSRKQTNSRKRKPTKPEYNRWVDDAYIMMGRAYLYQKDYIRASSTFLQIIRKYKDEPVKYQAYLWLVRTYSESERYTEARELIESLEGNDQFPEKLEGELAINAADLHLKQSHYDEAIQYLNIGIKKIRGNKRKTRYTYILAQLYQETDNKELALNAYHQVIRRRPDYNMLFNAQINSASVFSGDGDVSTLKKELRRMGKKKRNQPYLDQIYYALGNIVYNEGKTDDAIDYYLQSASSSVSNTYQRALSCLTLADIYFDRKNYIPSGLYYDSAMVVIDDNYPNYPAIKEKHGSLSNLVTNLLEVKTQDSLQYLASLSPNDLNIKIEGWIEKEQERMAAMNEEGAEGGSEFDQAYGRATSSRMRLKNQGSGWYFYNPSTVSYGKKEFSRIWGARKNEDHWRRSDKSISMTDEFGELVESTISDSVEVEVIRIDDPTTAEYYKQDIPSNDSLMAISHDKIRDALFNAGNIFKNEFNDYDRALECHNELNRRYPNNIHELPSYFTMWDLYNNVEKQDSSDYFKNEILDKYPQSNYAKYLVNPNYFIEEEARKDSINKLYSMAFTAYKYRNFQQAAQLSNQVLTMNPDSSMLPKVKFIQLISESRNTDQKKLAEKINAYLAEYPSEEIAAFANKILELVKEEKLTQGNYDELVNTGYLNEIVKNLELMPQNETTEQLLANKWDSDPELLHYFIIALPNDEQIDVNRLKFDIANYNIDHYTTLDFDIETETLNADTKLIVVRNFNQKESALIYFLSIIRKPQVFKTLAGVQFINFIVSNNNFREMMKDRTYNDYLQFFVKNYSSFTSGEFLDEELETPEELMARMNKDDDHGEDQGEFVLIDTDDGSYIAPEPKEQVYTLDYSAPHSVMIMIKESRFRTGFLMRDFVRYNASSHRAKRLRAIPINIDEQTLLVVSKFDDAYAANEYLKIVKENKELLKSISEVEYEIFVVSDENLKKLRETNDITEWDYFYRNNFIYRKPPTPKTETKEENVDKEQSNIAEPSDNIEPASTDVTEAETTASSQEVNTVSEETSTTEMEQTPQATEEVQEKTEDNKPKTETAVAENTATTSKETESAGYNGPFKYNEDDVLTLIYLLPTSGSNKTLLSTYLGRFNAMKYKSLGLNIETETFDDFRSIVLISGIGKAEKAKAYKKAADADNRVGMSLRNVKYKSYLISESNLKQLKENKDILEYQKFFDTYYAN